MFIPPLLQLSVTPLKMLRLYILTSMSSTTSSPCLPDRVARVPIAPPPPPPPIVTVVQNCLN